MKKFQLILLAALTPAALFCACTGQHKTKEAVSTTEKPVITVETAIAAARDFKDGIEVTGELAPKFFVDVRTELKGIVREVAVTEWVRVKKGDLLARLDSEEAQTQVQRAEAGVAAAKAAILEAEVRSNRAIREEERLQKLKESGLATRQSLDDAASEREAAGVRITAAKAQLAAVTEELHQARKHLSKNAILAPLDGVIGLRNVNVGDLTSDAAAGSPLFRIVDNRVLTLTVTVPASTMARIKVGQSINFITDSLPGKEFQGLIQHINPEVDSADRTVKVQAEVANPSETLKGGMFMKGRIITSERKGAILLPRAALLAWNTAANTAQVVVVTDNVAKIRHVSTGATFADSVEIIAGIANGEPYVVRGGFTVKDGDRVRTISATASPDKG